jgi:hypothetical protein
MVLNGYAIKSEASCPDVSLPSIYLSVSRKSIAAFRSSEFFSASGEVLASKDVLIIFEHFTSAEIDHY